MPKFMSYPNYELSGGRVETNCEHLDSLDREAERRTLVEYNAPYLAKSG